MAEQHDVIIAGGGPNGLLLACELALAGVRPVLLERLAEPSLEPKANGLVGRVIEALDYRGLAERFSGQPGRAPRAPFFQFGAMLLNLSIVDDHPLRVMMVPQARMEALLTERARELGVEIRREHEVTDLRQDADGVTLSVRTPHGEQEIRTRYLVGADGGRSTIRKRCGIGFPGITDDSFTGWMGSVVIEEPVAVPGTGELEVPGIGRLYPASFRRTERGLFAYGMFEPGRYRVFIMEWHRDEAETGLAGLRAAAGRVLGADIPMRAVEGMDEPDCTTAGINSRQADRYREGRVLLVGDSAHVHSGMGGPGLNLGLQDALNLGWKLAAVVTGRSGEELLDTYARERFPVGERVLMHTRAQTALVSPGPNVTAARALFEELLTEPVVTRRIAELMAGADIRYDMGVEDPHPLVGRWLPDVSLRTGHGPTRVAELMRAGRPLLLTLADAPELAAVAADWVDVVSAKLEPEDVEPTRQAADADAEPTALGASAGVRSVAGTGAGLGEVEVVLVRPDGYVAWAGNADTPGAAEALRRALATWFGKPMR
ncbi:FAD-dependent monooxygenase [Crossiella cryophila]|uniref:2-polyprenyl-6-methoxyphenol hydroxylase-like FAD-dependent oxidoreductase n=1 Tax=Crossiella cryophila TaxID=43355 RepID=A0A7W7C8W3_9PSEU|nr:FAD-dependent monooxygenase [Crossiella cryophila]MBB4676724.1 2-polyprenyl-6-methoxyphenol hydroxylase-like FAD-dependent oxidoreductase [Crossiella cryophila]